MRWSIAAANLWRQALLNDQIGLLKVADGIWQLRGFDIANMTLIEGRTGWIVVDTPAARETAAAAIAFARGHLGNKPVSATMFTHSHAGHFSGAQGVLSAEEARQREVAVVAPVQAGGGARWPDIRIPQRARQRGAVGVLAPSSAAQGLRGRDRIRDFISKQLGHPSETSTWRTFYLTGALKLRRGPPEQGIPRDSLLGMLQHTPIERFLESMAAALNAERAGDSRNKINLVFSDLGETHVLQLGNGVLHHHKGERAADANATLTLTKAFFLRTMTGKAGAKDRLLSDQTEIDGSTIDLARFLALLDKLP